MDPSVKLWIGRATIGLVVLLVAGLLISLGRVIYLLAPYW